MQKLKQHQSNFELIVEKQRVLQNLKSLQSHCLKKKSKPRHINRVGQDAKLQQQPGFLTKRESDRQSTDQPNTMTPRCVRTDSSPTQSSRLRKKRSQSKSKKTDQTPEVQFTSQEMAVFLFVNQAVSRIQRAVRNFLFRKKQRKLAVETQKSATKKQVRLQKLQQAIEVAKQQKQR